MQFRDYIFDSEILGRHMDIHVFGHFGTPIICFPSSMGRTDQFAGFGKMLDQIGDFVAGGKVKLYCVDGVDGDAWYNKYAHPGHRAWMAELYDRHLMDEVVPFIYRDCWTDYIPITTAGCSFGAYHAVNATLKHPWTFDRCIGMSGVYDVRDHADAYYDENVYFNNPVDFIGGVGESDYLDQLRRTDIRLVCGRGAWEHPHLTEDFSRLLHSRGIPNWCDLWGHDVEHHWFWWRRQFRHHIEQM
ncbi:MAG: transposase [Candidatus Wallbacteria bacterium]|nr:transposase [Candidatus Wallbacteria bacterium]